LNQLPPSLLQSLEDLPGFDKDAFEKVHQSGEQVTSIRFNQHKVAILDFGFWNLDPVPWSSQGYYLSSRPSFTIDPLFHAGAYYVQEASSMFLEEVLKQTVDLSQPLKVLDLCAAPGGKSTLIQSLISDESLLISNDVIKTRANILAENLTKWGAANIVVTNNDPKDFQRLENYFDVIVVDAPCSGSGLFRKDPEAINEWSEQNVQLCSQRQQRILADVLPALKENGILIYSTCSYSKDEDEEICDWMQSELSVVNYQLSIINYAGIIETKSTNGSHGYRFYPDKIKGEGFFMAAFKKIEGARHKDQNARHKTQGTRKEEKLSTKEIEAIKPYLKDVSVFSFIKLKDDIIAVPAVLEKDILLIQSLLYIRKAGIRIGTVIRDELIPDHELAMSTVISSSVPSIEVNEQTALQYLRRAEIKLDAETKGWALLTYQQVPLGWVKILPGRVNNYYPKDWRILNK
jgi:16S rRNA C967 or C1407 C5-methylase (RsmB/RsmF family)/NOL1/NOP2/fmu family ribosome biogenesis protein